MKETTYRLCPRCLRAVPVRSGERFCANDGERLLERCPRCLSPIKSPYTRFCVLCGLELASQGKTLRQGANLLGGPPPPSLKKR